MEKLKELYLANGKLRPYRADESGREFFYFEDGKNSLTVREVMPNESDARKIRTAIPYMSIDQILHAIGRYEEESPNKIFIIEDKVKFIAFAETKVMDKQQITANLKIYFQSDSIRKEYSEKVIGTLKFMCRKTWIYKHIYYNSSTIKEKII